MKLVCEAIPGAWRDNVSLRFDSEGPDPFQVAITDVADVILMLTPYSPDEFYSFTASLWSTPSSLIVRVRQRTDILGPSSYQDRTYVSTDGGRNWRQVDGAEVAQSSGGAAPTLIFEVR